MDQRVFDAARNGNTAEIQNDLPFNPDVSEWTPLHIACLLGNRNFAQEFLRRNPGFLKLVNPNGCNALHLASSNGHLRTVELLLTFNERELCMKRDKDGRIPLHHAVINGSVPVVNKLLEACPESALEVTDQRETVLHLAVKYKVSTPELFSILFGGPYAAHLQNLADTQGNTVLHLAVVRKQFQIVNLLISWVRMHNLNADANFQEMAENSPGNHRLEVNAVNSSGLTPLDLLVFDHMNKIDRNIERLIRSAGGIMLNESQEQRENLKSITSGLFIMASLIAAACCQVAVYLLGAFWTDSSSQTSTAIANVIYQMSTATNATTNNLLHGEKKFGKYTVFVFLDGLTLLFSLCLIVLLLLPTKAKYNLHKWVGLRILAYLTAVTFVSLFSVLVSSKMGSSDLNPLYLLFVPLLIIIVVLMLLPIILIRDPRLEITARTLTVVTSTVAFPPVPTMLLVSMFSNVVRYHFSRRN